METNARPPVHFPSTMACFGCNEVVDRPKWIRRDTRDYLAFCVPCLARLNVEFTVEYAVAQAVAICNRHQAELGGVR